MKKMMTAAIAAFLPLAAKAQDLGGSLLNEAAGTKGAGYKSGVSIETVIGTVISVFLGILGVIFLVLIVYAGYLWLIARGDESKVEKSKETMTRAVIGLTIVLGAYAITYYVLYYLLQTTIK